MNIKPFGDLMDLLMSLSQALIIAFGVALGSFISYFLMRREAKKTVRAILNSRQAQDFGEVFSRVKQLLNDEGLSHEITEILRGVRNVLKEFSKEEEAPLIKLPKKKLAENNAARENT